MTKESLLSDIERFKGYIHSARSKIELSLANPTHDPMITNYRMEEAGALRAMGSCYFELPDLDTGQKCYAQALSIYKELHLWEECISLLTSLGYYYFELFHLTANALDTWNIALSYEKLIDRDQERAMRDLELIRQWKIKIEKDNSLSNSGA